MSSPRKVGRSGIHPAARPSGARGTEGAWGRVKKRSAFSPPTIGGRNAGVQPPPRPAGRQRTALPTKPTSVTGTPVSQQPAASWARLARATLSPTRPTARDRTKKKTPPPCAFPSTSSAPSLTLTGTPAASPPRRTDGPSAHQPTRRRGRAGDRPTGRPWWCVWTRLGRCV